MVKMLDDVPEKDIVELNIPTGVPLLYDLDSHLAARSSRYLGDAEAVKAAFSRKRRMFPGTPNEKAGPPSRNPASSFRTPKGRARGA